MPPHQMVSYDGTIGDIFAHRFVLATAEGNILADLGPKGAEVFSLVKGDRVRITGEKKPSEVKVHTIAPEGRDAVVLEKHPRDKHPQHKHPHEHPQHEHVDPQIALRAADEAGFAILGEPHRKPKHFELRAPDAKGQDFELHIELDGRIRKQKLVGLA